MALGSEVTTPNWGDWEGQQYVDLIADGNAVKGSGWISKKNPGYAHEAEITFSEAAFISEISIVSGDTGGKTVNKQRSDSLSGGELGLAQSCEVACGSASAF